MKPHMLVQASTIALAMACFAGAPAPAFAEGAAAGGQRPLVLAQNKLDLEPPPPNYASKRKDPRTEDDAETTEPAKPSSGVSLSVSGTVGAQITTSSGSRLPSDTRGR